MLTAQQYVLSVDRALTHRTKRGIRTARRQTYSLERLESRTLLTYTFIYGGVNGPQTVNETGGNDSFTVANNGFGLLEWSTDNGATFSTTWGTGPAGGTLNASAAVTLTINLGADNSAIIDGTSQSPSSAASAVLANLDVNAFVGNRLDSLTIDDQTSTLAAGTYTYNGHAGTITGPLTGINVTEGPNPFGGGTTIRGSNAGNTFNVVSTTASGGIGEPLSILGGTSNDTASIEGTSAGAPATVNLGEGANALNIGLSGSLADIMGPVFVDNMPSPPGFTGLTVDASSDDISHDFTLSSSGADSTLLGLAPAAITYDTAALSSLTIDTSDFGSQIMNIGMSGGNPIPVPDSPGLTWNAGADAKSGLGTHILNILGELPSGAFASETHNAEDPAVGGPPHDGSIDFTDSLGTDASFFYSGLRPITDTTPALDYTFNDLGYPDQSFSATTGPVITGFQTLEFASTPTPPSPTNFETTDIANKANVTFNTPPASPGVAGHGVIGAVKVPTASTGLMSLTFNTPTGGDNMVSFVNTPPGVVTSLFDGAGAAVTNVTGLGVADGTVLSLNGGPATNTLNYDAGGEIPTSTPGRLSGEVLISIPGFGTVDAVSYQQINITDAGPLTITPGPARTINGVAGYPLVDAIVGTFTLPITAVFPAPPGGFPASDFTASIDWGDRTASGGMISEDTSNPSLYEITGTHTFIDEGKYTVANTVTFSGGTITTLVTGTPVSITYGPAGPTAGNSATADVAQDRLTVSAFPIAGTEGIPIPAGPIATFIDAAGAAPVADYSASIAITNLSGFSLVFAAASITPSGTNAQFTVIAPEFTLPEEGTYQVVVSVTDTAGMPPVTAGGASAAVIADAPLAAGAAIAQTGNTGILLSGYEVGSFTDANPGATISDFIGMSMIDWGDNLHSPASFVGVGPGEFNVYGSHTYAKPGVYDVTTNVFDVGGSTTTLSATFTITDLPLTGATTPRITAIEGMNTGPMLLATITDPNTLAMTSDVTASIDWGDGTPVGRPLAIQQIGVTPATSPSPGQPIFDVLGSHTYAKETSTNPFLPLAFTIDVTTPGGIRTTLTSPPGGGVTVLDAPLFGENAKPVTGTARISTGRFAIASFLDANTDATIADFTTLAGSTEVFWGDGSSNFLSAANYHASGSANGVVFTIHAAHTYAAKGQYTISVNVTDEGGQTTSIPTTASIHNTLSPLVQIEGGHVPPTAEVGTLVGISPHTTTTHKVSTARKAKPAVTSSHTVQKIRVHDAALRAIIVETETRGSRALLSTARRSSHGEEPRP